MVVFKEFEDEKVFCFVEYHKLKNVGCHSAIVTKVTLKFNQGTCVKIIPVNATQDSGHRLGSGSKPRAVLTFYRKQKAVIREPEIPRRGNFSKYEKKGKTGGGILLLCSGRL